VTRLSYEELIAGLLEFRLDVQEEEDWYPTAEAEHDVCVWKVRGDERIRRGGRGRWKHTTYGRIGSKWRDRG
jgi:hypothetical protein